MFFFGMNLSDIIIFIGKNEWMPLAGWYVSNNLGKKCHFKPLEHPLSG